MPRADGGVPASERLFHPRRFITPEEAEAGLAVARDLVRLGCPVGVAAPSLDQRGEWWQMGGIGGTGYWIPRDWEHTPADLATLNRYRRGDALFMVTGYGLDVLDIDPRNGGDDDLAEVERLGLVPPSFARAATPSGGEHRFLAPLGVRKTKRGGLDLQAGVGGQGHGFVFIAPTVRRSKTDAQIRPYRWVEPLESAEVGRPDDRAGALVAWFKDAAPTASTADEHHWNGNTDEWLTSHTTGKTLTPAVARAVQPFIDGEPFDGHDRMIRFQVHLARLAAEGHNGVPEALAFARTVWLDTPHASDEDPAQEWDVALDHAIQKYGGTTR